MMRKTILSGTAALGLLAFAGLAGAQQTMPTEPNTSGTTMTPPAPATTSPATSGTTPQGAVTTPGTMGVDSPATTGQYRSYSGMEKGSFQGTIAGGYSADDLIGKDVVGPDGNEIAEIADLVVESDNTVKKVIVDVGGFLGLGATPVALDIDQLQKGADANADLRTTMTKEQLKALPPYEKNDQGFYVPRTKG